MRLFGSISSSPFLLASVICPAAASSLGSGDDDHMPLPALCSFSSVTSNMLSVYHEKSAPQSSEASLTLVGVHLSPLWRCAQNTLQCPQRPAMNERHGWLLGADSDVVRDHVMVGDSRPLVTRTGLYSSNSMSMCLPGMHVLCFRIHLCCSSPRTSR